MKLLIISDAPSDLSRLLAGCVQAWDLVSPAALCQVNWDEYDAFAALGGVREEALTLFPPDRMALMRQTAKGKRVFGEYCRGIGQVSFLESVNTRFERPVVMESLGVTQGLDRGTILDEQSNNRLIVYKALNRRGPLLQYEKKPDGFYRVGAPEELKTEIKRFALWLDEPNLMVCSFRLANFSKAKFAPRRAWAQVISGIVCWLGGACTPDQAYSELERAYTLSRVQTIRQAAQKAILWFDRADMLVSYAHLPYAVKEGLSAHVKADGTHVQTAELRTDCTGEAAYMYYLYSLFTGRKEDLDVSDSLYHMPLDMQIREVCPHHGAVRGSLAGWWGVNYQDDTARGFLLPILWRAFLAGDGRWLSEARDTLDYLARSTGTDGLRVTRIDFDDMYGIEVQVTGLHLGEPSKEPGYQKWSYGGGVTGVTTLEELTRRPAGTPSAHYNAYYLASMLLGFLLLGDARYKEIGVKGLEAIMQVYPFTAREHSETQELCRLILPLALLYYVTGQEMHRQWLYRVTKDLQRMRCDCGAYREWDTGYTAVCADVKDGESAVFANNGDPVCDMLYSVNWLPQAYIVAYYVTGDTWFKELWESIVRYFASVQIKSADPQIDGAWSRAIDIAGMEVYGVTNDVGWSPWSVESGWTMAEVTSGMLLGLMEDQIKPLFQKRYDG